jgi:hypothetical protein
MQYGSVPRLLDLKFSSRKDLLAFSNHPVTLVTCAFKALQTVALILRGKIFC